MYSESVTCSLELTQDLNSKKSFFSEKVFNDESLFLEGRLVTLSTISGLARLSLIGLRYLGVRFPLQFE
jgi:hypothetical protein